MRWREEGSRYARLCRRLMVSLRVRGYKITREPSGPSSSILCHIAGIVSQSPAAAPKDIFSTGGRWGNQVCHLHLLPIRRIGDPSKLINRFNLHGLVSSHEILNSEFLYITGQRQSLCSRPSRTILQSPKVISEKRKSCQKH